MLGLAPPPGGGDISVLEAFGMLAVIVLGGRVYGFVMSLVYRRRGRAAVHEIRRADVRKAA